MERQRTFSGARWETVTGYCRALRVGQQIFVSGTSPLAADGSVHAPGDAYEQTRYCFGIVQKALQALGADLPDVVRTRLYVTDIGQIEAFARAHRECFADHPPANTLVEIAGLVAPDMLVEIEVDALCASPSS